MGGPGFNFGPARKNDNPRVALRRVVLHNGETVEQKALRVLADESRAGSVAGTPEYLKFTEMLGLDPQTGGCVDEAPALGESDGGADVPEPAVARAFGNLQPTRGRITGTRIGH